MTWHGPWIVLSNYVFHTIAVHENIVHKTNALTHGDKVEIIGEEVEGDMTSFLAFIVNYFPLSLAMTTSVPEVPLMRRFFACTLNTNVMFGFRADTLVDGIHAFDQTIHFAGIDVFR